MKKIRMHNRLASQATISFAYKCPCGWCNCLNCNLLDNMPHEGMVGATAAQQLWDNGFTW